MRLIGKLFITACAAGAMMPLTANAQTYEQVVRTETIETVTFRPHWFIQAQAGAAYTYGETKFADLISPAAQLSVGYKFSPVFGLRVGATGWQGKGSWVAPRHDYKFNYIQPNLDAMISFTNWFCGFNPTRVIDIYGFVGFAANLGIKNDEARDLLNAGYDMSEYWEPTKFMPGARAGLGINFNLSNSFGLNIEVNGNMLNDHFNSKKGTKFDWQVNALAGITYSFGGRSQKNVTVNEIIEQVYVEPVPEPEPEPVVVPAPVVEKKKIEPMTQDIFFLINSAKIRTSEQEKVDALVAYMKANPTTKVTITGYADKDTGTSSYNMALSKRRSAAVAAALEAAGIDKARITTEADGSNVQPFKVNNRNRVAIAITNE